jgi:hypothetical protein
MHKRINFCFDHLSDPELGYPNLAKRDLAPDEFDETWPRCLPVRLFAYFPLAGMNHRSWLVDRAPKGSWYPIGLAWHDFDCDYFSLLSESTHRRVKDGSIRMLFYYHEGDNPERIRERFESLRIKHGFPEHCYLFLSANSASDRVKDFMYFPDHELFFRYVNRHQRPAPINKDHRTRHFTALNRTHKWWRATCMADLHRSGLLDNSIWSYNHLIDTGDRFEDNPICLDDFVGLRQALDQFLSGSPYVCDQLSQEQHNDHRDVNIDHFTQSWCHIVIETHFDADQSGGTFLTEKTYKCLKFGQPFVIVGPAGSLKALRDRGYRVFDHAIDNSYDTIENNADRWRAVKKSIQDISEKDLSAWFDLCREDLEWNQQKILSGNNELLENLVDRLDQLSTGVS